MNKESKIKSTIKDIRQEHTLKVKYMAGKNSADIPMLNIQGRWFQLLGYNVGDVVKVSILEDNKILIEKA